MAKMACSPEVNSYNVLFHAPTRLNTVWDEEWQWDGSIKLYRFVRCSLAIEDIPRPCRQIKGDVITYAVPNSNVPPITHDDTAFVGCATTEWRSVFGIDTMFMVGEVPHETYVHVGRWVKSSFYSTAPEDVSCPRCYAGPGMSCVSDDKSKVYI